MENLLQLHLDFTTKSSQNFTKYVYLENNPSLGIGEITEENKNFFTIVFHSSRNVLQISKENPNLKTLKFDISALRNEELRTHEMKLALTAMELKLAHAFDKLSSLSNSRTRLLPHQIESTYVVVNSLNPRFILADEVGLGKTIEAALIMKELMFRNDYKKVLIVAPSPLLLQWQQELKNKFNEDFTIIKRKNFLNPNEFHWQNFDKLITSIDFIKNPRYAEEVLKRNWDIVIFDEAHRLRRDYSKITRAYVFAEKIARKCEALLLLTATPFRGKLEELYYLVHLIDPNLLGSYHTFVNDYVLGNKSDLKEKLSKILLRRRKVEVGGFTKRFAKTVKIELSEQERVFYNETTEYVKREYNLAMRTQNRAIGFVMIVFQKLLDSSVFALLSALRKRKFLLENRLHRFNIQNTDIDEWDIDDTENVEEFVGNLEDSTYKDLANTRRELLTLNRLIHIGNQIKEDRKTQKLKEVLQKLKREGHKKFIIFTQFRSTQEYLYSVLSNEFSISMFHGSLTMEQKEEAIIEFKKHTEILICTEAGGEGRNLQFANVLFNYDLPWSPLKIEQRIGRIHRFGQKENVYIFNFASKDTVAERILEVLTNKIKLFEESIGASDALLGTIEHELDFNSSLMKFITGTKTKEELEEELDMRIKVAEQGFQKLENLLTPKLLDFNLQDYYKHTLQEREFDNSHLEKFFLEFNKYFPKESKVTIKPHGNKIYKIQMDMDSKLATFDSELALQDDSLEFLAFGHPLIENAITYFIYNKIGYSTQFISSEAFYKKIIFVFLVSFEFKLKRMEIFYYEYDLETKKVQKYERIPEILEHSNTSYIPEQTPSLILENILLNILPILEEDIQKRKAELEEQTAQLFQREEYKIKLMNQKTLRHLQEKLDRQEANARWEPKPEKRAAINRTRNEILKANQEFYKELNKLQTDKNIQVQYKLFQVYYGKGISNPI